MREEAKVKTWIEMRTGRYTGELGWILQKQPGAAVLAYQVWLPMRQRSIVTTPARFRELDQLERVAAEVAIRKTA
jgi:hypothetical protein